MRWASAQVHAKACKRTRRQVIKGRQGGMTLLEVLVALAIMAMALGMIYRVAGGAARSSADIVQRQQATAIVAARQKIVEGAVGMVEMALADLKMKDIIEFDEEKKAAIVSNLMVVLCSDRSASPVLNVGTLNQ